jgi:hypothetical protein
MKKIIVFIGLSIALLACKKESLELINPNEPGMESLTTEDGIRKASYGIYNSLSAVQSTSSWYYYIWFTQWIHNVMGDATVSHVGNYGIRWANQTAQIIRPDGSTVTPPVGGKQHEELNNRNTRDWGSDNVQAHEWFPAYSLIGHCNVLLDVIDDVNFKGYEDIVSVKKKTYMAWSYWWKGFAYSRLGSIYKQGVINNTYGEQASYVSQEELINEAERNFKSAIELLNTIDEGDATYLQIMSNLIPSHFQTGNGGVITPSMFIRNINTYLARNILVNKYAADLTAAELTEVENYSNNGVTQGDLIFTVRSAASNCLVYETAWSGYRLNLAWERVSERLIQDFRPGDNRLTRNFYEGTLQVNPGQRGFQYSTRWLAQSVDDGGEFMSYTAGAVEIPLACSYEENQLMLAEVKIRRGEVDAGLAHIDNVRTYQNAGLTDLSGAGLTQEEALEELRSERRVGLFMKNVAFYDARRWGVLKPLSQGGGRQDAIVVFEGGVPEVCTIEYDYKEWFDVPANETDFNALPASSASSANPSNIPIY